MRHIEGRDCATRHCDAAVACARHAFGDERQPFEHARLLAGCQYPVDAAFDQVGAKFHPRSPGIPRSHDPLDGIDTDGGLSPDGASKERNLLLFKFAC